jgi:uncharacterized membrane protein
VGESEGNGVGGEGFRRFWDVDVARGVAMIMVVLYHLVYDLDNFGGYGIESTAGFWAFFADASASAFLFLVGLSLAISSEREWRAGRRGLDLFGKYARRGARIFLYGMLITFVFVALGYGYVIFGILHLIGLSIVLAYPLLGRRLPNLILGIAIVVAGAYLRAAGLSAPGVAGILLAPLGVLPEGVFMPDYRPLLPWFGVVLLGLFFGNAVYLPLRKKAPAAKPPPYAAPVAFLGRHTLLIYLVHQPVLIATLWALGVVKFGP